MVAPPYLLVSLTGTNSNKGLFLVYDPDDGCQGHSYIVILSFTPPTDCTSVGVLVTGGVSTFDAGTGAAAGFAIARNEIIVSKSAVGEGGQASILVPNIGASGLGSAAAFQPVWWKELK